MSLWTRLFARELDSRTLEILRRYDAVLYEMAMRRDTMANITRLPAEKGVMKKTLLAGAKKHKNDPVRVAAFLSGYLKLCRFQAGVSAGNAFAILDRVDSRHAGSDLDDLAAHSKEMEAELSVLAAELSKTGLLTKQMVVEPLGLNVHYVPLDRDSQAGK